MKKFRLSVSATAAFCLLSMCCLLLSPVTIASVYFNHHYQHKLPDGTIVELVVNGGKYYARTETPSGYTVIFDAKQQKYFYALLSDDGERLISSGIAYMGDENIALLTMPKHLRISHAARKKIIEKNQRIENERESSRFADDVHKKSTKKDIVKRHSQSISMNNLVGNLTGITIMIDFSDDVSTVPVSDVDNYLNLPGYSQYNNSGSIKDYWSRVSGGLLNYHNNLLGYYRAQQPKSYYTSDTTYNRARELMRQALEFYVNSGYDFSQLTVNTANNEVMAINFFYAGFANSPWLQGLWPHQSYQRINLGNGVFSGRYQMTPMNNQLNIGMFCHESGHMIAGYSDLYDYGNDSYGAGRYGLMAFQHATSPLPPNPYFRQLSGWEHVIELNPAVNSSAPSGVMMDMTSDTNSYRYSNPANPNESFFIEAAFRDAKGKEFPDEGLLIWHIDAAGSNGCQAMTPSCHYYVSVEQADGLFHLENFQNSGGPDDLFHQGNNTQFSDYTFPDAKWWDGSLSGLNIVDVGVVEANICFAVDVGSCSTGNQLPIANIDGSYSGTVNSAINFSSLGSYDPDGTIVSYDWNFGDGNHSTQSNPSHVYTVAGTYTVSLRVTDNLGGSSNTATTIVTVTDSSTIDDVCAIQGPVSYVELFNGEPICVASSSGDMRYFYFYVEEGITQIRLRTDHGNGNADLYYSYSGWPSSSYHHQRSTNADNTEIILFSYPPEGWNYISIDGSHNGLSLQVDMQ